MEGLADIFRLITTPEGILTIIASGGYVALVLIVFAETGLFFGFFLPGDSLLVMAGLAASTGALEIGTLNALLIPAAILGDALGYTIGHRSGARLDRMKDSRFFKRKHLDKSRRFYQRHGPRTIIIARFVPIIRTFAPVVAGMSGLPYRRYVPYNVIGAVAWIGSLTLMGYWLGSLIPNVSHYVHIIIGAVIILSVIPAILEIRRERAEDRAVVPNKDGESPERPTTETRPEIRER